MNKKTKRYALVGTGGRAPMFLDPIFESFTREATLVAMVDQSAVRMNFHQTRIRETTEDFDCPCYPPEDFARMLRETKPDVVLICSPDFTHHRYIIESVSSGCDVVTEKPITIDAAKCRSILNAVSASGRNVRVIFNYRWMVGPTKIKELLMQGAIGNVQHVSLNYSLNTRHGADYFRRWHSQMKFSGGLLVHKATHHFDLVNWWINDIPKTVYAKGRLAFYGKKNAIARGDARLTKYKRYTHPASEGDPFRLDIAKSVNMRGLYLDAEKDNGYIRDKNVFRDDIDIYDTMSVLTTYRSGVVLNYSLNAFSPDEGIHVVFMGDRGRIEYKELHASHIIAGQTNKALAKEQKQHAVPEPELILTPLFQESQKIKIEIAEGSHGGGDALLHQQIFSRRPPKDKLFRNAGHEQGIASAIIGIAANRSILTNRAIEVDRLVNLPAKARRLSDLK